MTPAKVDIVLAHLADAAAALPRAARQLGDILPQAKENHVLQMDTLTEIEDPDLAINAARLHLDGVGEAAGGLYRLLDAAHNETSHIAVADRLAKHTEEHAQDITSLAPGRRTGSRRWVGAGQALISDCDARGRRRRIARW